MYLDRKINHFLKNWLTKTHRKPLIIRGARQIGKSTSVRLFAKQEGRRLIECNLEERPLSVFAREKTEAIRLEEAIQEIESIARTPITDDCILFLDEIQEQPNALRYLRYFHEKRPDIPVIAAGSLLEFTFHNHDFSMPVGRVEFYHMAPMFFSEFLVALGDEMLAKRLQSITLLTQTEWDELHWRYRQYQIIGGMPEAVAAYLERNSLQDVQEIHASIVSTYKIDFPKYEEKGKNLGHIEAVFNYTAAHLGEKVQFSAISEARSAQLKEAIHKLELARVIFRCVHSHGSGLPLKAGENEKVFKLFFLDIGLVNYLQGHSYDQILSADSALLTKGKLAEQFVAQHLVYQQQGLRDPELNFWLRDAHTQKAEVDFLLALQNRVIPVEVKAGSSKKIRSLDQFVGEKELDLGILFSMEFQSEALQKRQVKIHKDGQFKEIRYNLLHLPIFQVEGLAAYIAD